MSDDEINHEINIEDQIKLALLFHRLKMQYIAKLIREAAFLLTGENEKEDQRIAEVFALAIKTVFES